MNPTAKIAQLLRTSEEILTRVERKMEKITGKKGVFEKLAQENEQKIKQTLAELEFIKKDSNFDYTAEQIFQALLEKVKENDLWLFNHFHQPDFSTASGCRSLINATKELTNRLTGFYLKEVKAKELLKLNPPRQIMTSLGYGNDIDKMLAKEDCFEIFAALRFVEDKNWLNDVFFKAYQGLKKDDFEQREIKVMVLSERWLNIGQKFLGKKLHHMSHLKELGLVFTIPIASQGPGETLYFFFMALHYIYEVDWHAHLFEKYSQEKDFALKMIKALRVETSQAPLADENEMAWRIVPQYLAKDNPNDSRLFEPHISPEAWHYTKVNRAIEKFSQRFPNLGLDFWQGLDTAGEYFISNNNSQESILVSFDLFDNTISLLQKIGFKSKYLYHQQEALWNKIFIEYLGEEKMDELMMENLDKGYVIL